MQSVDIQRKDANYLEARNNPGEAFEDWLMTERQCIRILDTWDAKHLRSGLIWNQRNKQINSAVSMDPVRNFGRFAQIRIFVDDKTTELISSNWATCRFVLHSTKKDPAARCMSNTKSFRLRSAVQSERHVANPARERSAKPMAEGKTWRRIDFLYKP